jgi:hypothetical protein
VPDDSDAMAKFNVLSYFVRHGQPSDLPRFVDAVVSGTSYVREAGVEGVAKFGTARTFVALRTALASASEENVGYVRMALYQLTFMGLWGPHELADWDSWWKTQASRTREDWAQDALDRSAAARANANSQLTMHAIRYMADAQVLSELRIEQGLNASDWLVRSAMADAIAKNSPARAAALYLGDLDSRYLGACRNAAVKLSALAMEKVDVDCTIAAERQQAIARWRRLLDPR